MNIMEWTEHESPLAAAKRYGVLEQLYRVRLEARREGQIPYWMRCELQRRVLSLYDTIKGCKDDQTM